ncbi:MULTISPECIES: outer membrane lipoprotein carrier protein LolA [Pontibacter]|uniref:Outer membrane lipoprotein-sorting protein n=1 Tax=Pontibacter lucknowensis TaxID=1077936 RepID=A0A1N6T365_9BACT|nr:MULTISPECIES: outer membrane lipoprotein carrier protein LolA [Pontibacter]EJF09182.1 gliding motility-like protein [Pontibacter sp. BAB1700]SIQ47773.1 Outer membrane lipoprotein-sorting protein [Pontibacter lucknowensis]
MKRVLSLLLAVFMFVNLANAQQDPKAGKILDQMSQKYRSMKAFKATFAQTLENPSAKVKETMEGDILVSGPKYRLAVSGQEIISDGKLMWTYLKEVNEVTITETDAEAEAMAPSKIFDMYKKGYKYAYAGTEKQGADTYDVIELAPEDRSNPIFKVRLHINQKDKSLKSWQMFRNNGNRYTYTIKNFQANPELASDAFSFNKAKYKGVQVVDLR